MLVSPARAPNPVSLNKFRREISIELNIIKPYGVNIFSDQNICEYYLSAMNRLQGNSPCLGVVEQGKDPKEEG